MNTPGLLSTFRFCEAVLDLERDVQYLTDPVPFTYQEFEDTIPHIVSEGDTYETIAAYYYRSLPEPAQLWRIVAEFQPTIPVDATTPPPPGSTVYVPSERTVREEIFNEARRPDYEA